MRLLLCAGNCKNCTDESELSPDRAASYELRTAGNQNADDYGHMVYRIDLKITKISVPCSQLAAPSS